MHTTREISVLTGKEHHVGHSAAGIRLRCGRCSSSVQAFLRRTDKANSARNSQKCWLKSQRAPAPSAQRTHVPPAAPFDTATLASHSSSSAGGLPPVESVAGGAAADTTQRGGAQAATDAAQAAAASESDVSPEEAQRRLKRAADLLTMVHIMAPSDPDTFNRALVLWTAIRDVPSHLRPQLLDRIAAADIERLWRTSAERYVASGPLAQAALGPSYTQWQDFPDDIGQVAVFEGRASVPVPGLAAAVRLDRFRKLFFLHPDTEELVGRVDVGFGPLGSFLHPLYFRSAVSSSIVPATREIADMQLEYAGPATLALTGADLPDASWPEPQPPRWPFSGDLSDYMRAVGPGVYVGVGWKAPRPGKDAGRRFLTFMLVRRPDG